MRGCLSGSQNLSSAYDGTSAYGIADNSRVSAEGYNAKVVAKVAHSGTRRMLKYFQVRTRTTVNMTNNMRLNLALLGGSAAIYAAIVRDKSSLIYSDCMRVCPLDCTLRAFLIPILREGLMNGTPLITIADDVQIANPWKYSGTQTVNLPTAILGKFNNVLSNL